MNRCFGIIILLIIFQTGVYCQNNSQIELVGFEPSECLEEVHVYELNNRIVSIERYSDTTIVEISIRANCCISLIPNIIVTGDTIDLDFDYYEPIVQPDNGDTIVIIREECDCDCCFSLRYFLTGDINDNIVYTVDESKLEKSNHKYKVIGEATFDIWNGDTINYRDIYGFRQGVHLIIDSTKQIIRERYFCDNQMQNGLFLRIKKFDGRLVSDYYLLDSGNYKRIEYHSDGSKKKECYLEFFLDEGNDCIEYKMGEENNDPPTKVKINGR